MPQTERILAIARRGADGLAIALIAVAMGGVVLARVLPALDHPVFVVAGPSMAPAIDMGSAIVLETVGPSDLTVGDVVSLRSGPQRAIFTHRVVRVVDRDGQFWIETKGDANRLPDPSITPASAVIGRVTAAIPFAGYLIALLSVPVGIVLVIALGLLLLTLGWWLDALLDEWRRAGGAGGTAPSPTTVARPGPETLRRRRRARVRTATSAIRRA